MVFRDLMSVIQMRGKTAPPKFQPECYPLHHGTKRLILHNAYFRIVCAVCTGAAAQSLLICVQLTWFDCLNACLFSMVNKVHRAIWLVLGVTLLFTLLGLTWTALANSCIAYYWDFYSIATELGLAVIHLKCSISAFNNRHNYLKLYQTSTSEINLIFLNPGEAFSLLLMFGQMLSVHQKRYIYGNVLFMKVYPQLIKLYTLSVFVIRLK